MSEACFENFNDFLFDSVGTAGEAVSNFFDDNKKVRHAFFKPYSDPSDFCKRASTIISAPIACAILAIETLGFAIFFAFDALVELCQEDTGKAAEAIKSSGFALLGMFAAIIMAFISPLINLIDLIGGGVAPCEEKVQLDPGY